jgi:diguanylate cyclase (GGDEF)-like protein
MARNRLINRFIPVGLVIILIFLCFITLTGIWVTRTSNESAQHATVISNLYLQARYWASIEESAELKYRTDPSPSQLATYRDANKSLDQILQSIIQSGPDPDRDTVQAVLVSNQNFLGIILQMFSLIDKGDWYHANEIDKAQAAPLLGSIRQMIDTNANKYYGDAQARQDDVRRFQDMGLVIAPVAFSICLLLILVLARYHWKMLHTLNETKQHEIQQLNQAALIDSLTGIGNHRAYQEDIQHEIQRASRYGFPLSLALINIDRFKELNENNGHAFGDQILVTLSGFLQRLLSNGLAYRLGGDTFAVLLPHSTLEQAQVLVKGVQQAIQDELHGTTISVGLAEMNHREAGMELLREQADAALYEAKQQGRNMIVTFTDISDNVSLMSAKKVQALHQLLQDQQMDIVFQPIWDVKNHRLLAVEALSRPASKYGFSGPQELFDVAERTGYEAELDLLSISAILKRIDSLPKDIKLFINLCPHSLGNELFAGDKLMNMVRDAGLTPESVTLEITERAINRLDVVIKAVEHLKASGFRIALDDTGAGNSGLELLTHIAVDYVKVDRGVLVKAMVDKTARGVLAGIIAISQAINSDVIVEGVEDQAMLDTVTQLTLIPQEKGSLAAQGYYLGRPSEVIPQTYPHQESELAEPDSLAA